MVDLLSMMSCAPNVYIEAENAEEANEKALQIGIYFNGVEDGIDCPCCGDRWYPVSERDAVENMPKDEYHFGWCDYVIFYGKDMAPVKIYKEGK